MSQVIDLCEDSDDNSEYPDTASAPSLFLSRKRPRDKEEASNNAYPHNENGSGNKTGTGSTELVLDLELAAEVEMFLKGVRATEIDVGGEDAQVTDRRESRDGIAAAASHPINADSEQRSRDDGKHSQKVSNSKQPSSALGWQRESLSAAAVAGGTQQEINEEDLIANNRLHLEGKTSSMTSFRIQEMESLGFEWNNHGTPWEARLSELADYRKIHGPCNVPRRYSEEDTKLGQWVVTQRASYKMRQEGKISQRMTPFRIQELKKLRFRMEVLHHRLGRPFERTCRLSQNSQALQCSSQLQRKHQAGWMGRKPKDQLHVVCRRKEIASDHPPNPGIGKLRFRMEGLHHRLGRLFERACWLS
jgi:hypothetical protein